MIALTLGQIAELVGGVVQSIDDSVVAAIDASGVAAIDASGVAAIDASGVLVTAPASVDSRRMAMGGLFVAAVGEHVDGHDFVAAALAAGAAGSLVTREVEGPHVVVDDVVLALGRLARAVVDRLVTGGELQVVALTGSSGKTSTKDLLAQVLPELGPTVATAENLNNELGVPLTALVADESTRYLVLEMGARVVGDIAYLTAVAPPRIGLVLNVGAAHSGEFGGLAGTARAKSELVQALPPGADGGIAVLNIDDPRVAAMTDVTPARVVSFGVSIDADVRADHVTLDAAGRPSFLLHVGAVTAPVSLQLYGAHQVSNALGVAAVATELGLDVSAVADALRQATSRNRWRMQVTHRADGVTIVNDAYNANPDSMRAGLEALVAMGRAGQGRTWAVLGEMLELGAASDAEHAEIGRLARTLGVDRLVVVGQAARGIHAGALAQGARDGEDSVAVPDSVAAHTLLRDALRAGDLVLFKSSRDAGLRWLGDAVAEEAAQGIDPQEIDT